MHVNLKSLQLVVLITLLVLLYAGRMVKGAAKEAPDGLIFGLKPIMSWTRSVFVPLYLVLFFWSMWLQQHRIPFWMLLVTAGLVMWVLYQLPGTIVLTPTGIEQRFWLRQPKKIQYNEVMAIQVIGAGRMTRAMGDNRVSITHTWNHSAPAVFREELARRTGKRVIV
jgi:hypothetical protein